MYFGLESCTETEIRYNFRVMIRRLGALALVASLLAATGWSKDKWIRLRSPNFEAYSNSSEKKSRKLLSELEQFRAVFFALFGLDGARQLPVRVMIFRDDASFAPYKPLYQGKPSSAAGYFQQGRDYNLIAMRQDTEGESLRIIFHEYVHLLTSSVPRRWPVWLNEGMAEFYSTFRISGDKVILGSPVSYHANLLREKTMLPLGRLLDVAENSVEYNEESKKGILYAQSWAFVHFLMMDDQAARRPQLTKYIQLLYEGRGAREAAGEAFPESFEQLEAELRRYVSQPAVYTLSVKLEDFQAVHQISVQPVSEAGALVRLGDVLLHTRRLDEAAALYQKALNLNPGALEAYEGMGLLALRKGENEQARFYLEKAAAANSDNFLVHLYYGRSLMEAAGIFRGGRPDLSENQFRTAAAHLRRAGELMPGSAEAHYLLASLHLVAQRDLEQGVVAIRRSLRLKPQDRDYLQTLADLQLGLRDWKGARETIEELDSTGSFEARQLAAERLRYLDYLERLEREPDSAAGDDAPPLPISTRSETGAVETLTPDVECLPDFTDISAAVALEGRLLRVECDSAIVYVVEINGRETRLVGENPALPVVFGCEIRLETFECGPLEYPVTVFLPSDLPKDEATGHSLVRAIELKAPE